MEEGTNFLCERWGDEVGNKLSRVRDGMMEKGTDFLV